MCERFNLLRTIRGVLKGVSESGLVIRVFSPTGQQQEPIILIVSIQLALMQPTRVTAPLHPASLPPFNALPQGDCDKLYMGNIYIVSLHLNGILMSTTLIHDHPMPCSPRQLFLYARWWRHAVHHQDVDAHSRYLRPYGPVPSKLYPQRTTCRPSKYQQTNDCCSSNSSMLPRPNESL